MNNPITLRPYQQTAVDEVRVALGKYRRVLFQLPTGGGKTICFSYMALSSQRFNRKVLIVSSRTEILMQNGGALERFGLDVSYISPKSKKIPATNVVVGMAQTIRRRMENPEWLEYLKSVEMMIVDECHESVADPIHETLSENCFVLGVTATPRRRGTITQLGDLYKAMVQGVTVKELIDLGYLSKAKYYSIAAPKLDDIPIDYGRGDYNQKALAAKFENKTLYKGVVDEFMRLTPDKKAIFFCCSSQQTIAITKELNDRGIPARYLLSGNFEDDDMYSGKRSDVIEDFKHNKFQVLVNLGIAIAGFDQPDVEVVVLNYATISITKYLQSVGRGSRVTPTKKDFVILDCGENFRKHGFYEDDRVWCLWHDNHVGTGPLMVKECDTTKIDCNGHYGCGQLVPVTMKVCKNCGYVFRTEQFEYQLHLEEVSAQSEANTIEKFCAEKRLEGWKLSRIMVSVCLANAGNERKAFIKAYLALNPSKTAEDAGKYYFVWRKNVWDKIKTKRVTDNGPKLI